MSNNHGSGCKCFTCGGGAKDFLPVDGDIYECGWCGNWYKAKPDGTIEYPNVRDAVEAGINKKKKEDLQKQGVSAEKCSVTLKDLENSEYVANAIADAMEKSDMGQATRDAIHKELFNIREKLENAEKGKNRE